MTTMHPYASDASDAPETGGSTRDEPTSARPRHGPAGYLDPLPADGDRASHEIHELVAAGRDRLEVRPGPGQATLVRTFRAVAGALIGIGLAHAFLADDPDWILTGFLVPFGAAFAFFAWTIPRGFKPIAIDGRRRTFVRGSSETGSLPRPERLDLDDVLAVQALQVRASKARTRETTHRTYDVWQVNLALVGGRRTNVLMHTEACRALQSAARIARLVGVEVVDQTAALD